jgi:hypothetical protein
MSNSAFTPSNNLSVPATTTQAGTVSTVAQTFAGKKTFDGGAAIKGDITGSAIASGYVGEFINNLAAASINQTGSTGSDLIFNTAGAPTLTLKKGLWLLVGSTGLACTGSLEETALTIRNTTANTDHGIAVGYTSSGNLVAHTVMCPVLVTVDDSVFYLKGRRTAAGTAVKMGATNGTISSGQLSAIRIA